MPHPIAFTHDGVDFKAWPERGCFFGVSRFASGSRGAGFTRNVTLLFAAMMNDGTPDTIDGAPNVGEVSNMYEEGDDQLLEAINAEFGVALKQSDFAGR